MGAYVHGDSLKLEIKKFDDSDINEQIAGYGIKEKRIRVQSTLIDSKIVSVFDPTSGQIWDYCVGNFRCVHPEAKKSFEVSVLLKAIEPDADPVKEAKLLVASDNWKGIEARTFGDKKILLIDDTLSNVSIKIHDGKSISFKCSICVYLDLNGNVITDTLPFRSYMKDKNSNGLINYWWPFSNQYLVANMNITKASDYGDQVSSVRILFYDLKNKKILEAPLDLNVENMSKEPSITIKSGKETMIVTEALERPIKVFSLNNGQSALKMFLPSMDNRKAGEYLLIPEL